MPITLKKYANIIRKRIANYEAKVIQDSRTDNLVIVINCERAFVVTRKYLSDHSPSDAAAEIEEIIKQVVMDEINIRLPWFSRPMRIGFLPILCGADLQ